MSGVSVGGVFCVVGFFILSNFCSKVDSKEESTSLIDGRLSGSLCRHEVSIGVTPVIHQG